VHGWTCVCINRPLMDLRQSIISAHTQRTHSSINTGGRPGRGKPDLKRGRESQSTNGKMPVLPYSSHSLQSQTLGYIQIRSVSCTMQKCEFSRKYNLPAIIVTASLITRLYIRPSFKIHVFPCRPIV